MYVQLLFSFPYICVFMYLFYYSIFFQLESSLESVCNRFLARLLHRKSFGLHPLTHTVADVFMERPVLRKNAVKSFDSPVEERRNKTTYL